MNNFKMAKRLRKLADALEIVTPIIQHRIVTVNTFEDNLFLVSVRIPENNEVVVDVPLPNSHVIQLRMRLDNPS